MTDAQSNPAAVIGLHVSQNARRSTTAHSRWPRHREGFRVCLERNSLAQCICVGDTSPEKASDAEAVALEERHGQEGSYRVECHWRSVVDTAQTDAHDAGEYDGVCRNMSVPAKIRDPIREREPLISFVCPHVACDSSKVTSYSRRRGGRA